MKIDIAPTDKGQVIARVVISNQKFQAQASTIVDALRNLAFELFLEQRAERTQISEWTKERLEKQHVTKT